MRIRVCMHVCACAYVRVSTCLTAQLSVGVCLHHVLCWVLQARVWEPPCTLLGAHMNISP